MKLAPAVKKETRNIAIGTLSLTGLMLLGFAVAGAFDYTVLLGAIWGAGFAILNFFMLAYTVQKATELDEENARLRLKMSYSLRMTLTLIVAAFGVIVPFLHWATVLAPLLFPRITIALMSLRRNRKES